MAVFDLFQNYFGYKHQQEVLAKLINIFTVYKLQTSRNREGYTFIYLKRTTTYSMYGYHGNDLDFLLL